MLRIKISTYCKPATLLKLTLLHWCFPRFLNCTNATKSRNASHTIKIKIQKLKSNNHPKKISRQTINNNL